MKKIEHPEILQLNTLTEIIIGCAIEIHRNLGPGLLESVYQKWLAYELAQKKLNFELEKYIQISYKQINVGAAFRADMIVENKVVLELKAIEKILPIHEAQLITYLKLAKMPIGLLLNFNVTMMKNGIKRIILK